jgi:fumarate reductase (CoM/CoB) subunit A
MKEYDVIIIGGGLGGVMTVHYLQRSGMSIALLEKGKMYASGSTFANINQKWGITYAFDDTEKSYLLSLINEIGNGRNDAILSEILVEHSYAAFLELVKLGVEFEQDNGVIRRVAPCFTTCPLASIICNASQVRELFYDYLQTKAVQLFEHYPVDTIHHDGSEYWVCGHDKFKARYGIVLATGGDIALYKPNIVSDELTGDGFTIAQGLNIRLVNVDCKQRVWDDVNGRDAAVFQPRMFFDDRYQFYDYNSCQIVLPSHLKKLKKSRCTHVPISNHQSDRSVDELFLGKIPEMTPAYAITVKKKGDDKIINRILPHYQVSTGGVLVDIDGQTTRSGIYAVGEVAAGMHGEDRVGGMMICSAVVFARQIANHIMSVAAC